MYVELINFRPSRGLLPFGRPTPARARRAGSAVRRRTTAPPPGPIAIYFTRTTPRPHAFNKHYSILSDRFAFYFIQIGLYNNTRYNVLHVRRFYSDSYLNTSARYDSLIRDNRRGYDASRFFPRVAICHCYYYYY